jgi:hypothetical protein
VALIIYEVARSALCRVRVRCRLGAVSAKSAADPALCYDSRGDRARNSSIRFDASAFVSVSSNSAPASRQRLEIGALRGRHGLVSRLPPVRVTPKSRLVCIPLVVSSGRERKTHAQGAESVGTQRTDGPHAFW